MKMPKSVISYELEQNCQARSHQQAHKRFWNDDGNDGGAIAKLWSLEEVKDAINTAMLDMLTNNHEADHHDGHDGTVKKPKIHFQRVQTKDWLMTGYQLPVWRLQPFSVTANIQKFCPFPSPELPLKLAM